MSDPSQPTSQSNDELPLRIESFSALVTRRTVTKSLQSTLRWGYAAVALMLLTILTFPISVGRLFAAVLLFVYFQQHTSVLGALEHSRMLTTSQKTAWKERLQSCLTIVSVVVAVWMIGAAFAILPFMLK